MMEGVNSTKIYCKDICKCHSVPQYNNNMIIKKGKKNNQTAKSYLHTKSQKMTRNLMK
jgi:hypothetical protein